MRTLRGGLGLLASLGAMAAHAATALEAGAERIVPLASGATIELDLAVAPGSAYSVEVTEQGIDARITLHDGDRSLRGFDGDILRRGHFRVAVDGAGSSAPRLAVAATRPGSPGGEVRVAFGQLPPDDSARATRFALDLLETETAQRYYDPKRSKEPDSVELARRLVSGRREAGPRRDLARAYLLLDQTLMKQFRYDEAVATLEQSLPVFRELDDKSGEASALNDIGMHRWRKGDSRGAAEPLAQALEVATAANDPLLRALVKSNICNLELSRGALSDSVACTRTALAWSEATGDMARIAMSWNNLGGAYSLSGQPRQAIAAFERAADLRERSGVQPGPAQAIANSGLEYQAIGRFDEAEQRFVKAEALVRAEGDERLLGTMLRYRGQLRSLLGNHAEASALLEEALAHHRKLGQGDEVLRTLTRVGEAHRLRDGRGSVPAALVQALDLAERSGNPAVLGDALLRVAQVHVDDGRPDAAEPLLARASDQARDIADQSFQATVQLVQARNELVRGSTAEAERVARAAWARMQQLGLPLRAAEASGIAADALAARGRYAESVPLYARGAAEVARARAEIADPELRARFFATQRRLHEGHVAALAEIALASGARADAVRSLATADGYRAQVLSELLEQGTTGGQSAPDRETAVLREREASLAAARWRLSESGAPEATRAAVERALAEASARVARGRAVTRGRRAGEPAPSFDELLRGLPRELTVVEFMATPKQSYAWVATRASIRVKRLAGENALAPTIERARAAVLSRDAASDWATPLAQLCDVLWTPLGVGVDGTRVALVPDGALQQVPWAALRCAGEGGGRSALVDTNELSMLPALRALRGSDGRPAGIARGSALAVVDPVYERGDVRIGGGPAPGASLVASDALVLRGRSLARLGATHEEARLLERLLGPDRVTVLEGFEADRASVVRRLAQPSSLVHFGTHGVATGADLAGSGLVLSLIDRSGGSREGFLSAREIAGLEIRSALVVLAACESGQGAAVANEGLQSLAYGFLAAGARNVVASSWPVADAPTGRLMAEFYQALLARGERPAAALREAQRVLARDPYWRHPSFWAGFSVTDGGSDR